MAHKSVIILQKPNEHVHPTYAAIMCKDFPSYFGVAAIQGGKIVTEIVKGTPKPEAFADVSEVFGKNWMAFALGKAGQDILEEDIQPFELLKDKDGQVIAVGFFDGQFEGYTQPKSSHIDEYHLVNDVLIPKLKKIYRSVGGGIPELIEELNDPVTKQDFNNCWTHRGNITIFTAEGPPITFTGQNIYKADFNWGWTSNAGNYKEQTVAKVEPKADAEAPLTLRQKLLAKAGLKQQNGATTIVDVKTDVIGPVKPTLTSAAAINAVMEEYEDVRLPADANNWVNKKKIEYWIGEIGYKPEGYKDLKTTAKRRKGTKMGVLHPLFSEKAKEEAVAKGQATPLVVDNNAPAASVEAPMINTEAVNDHVKDTSIKNVTTAYMPIISPKQKAGLRTSWMKDAEVVKVLGDDFKATIDPKELKGFEETFPTFWSGFGIEGGSRPLSYEAYVKLGECDPRALAKLAWDNQNDALRLQLKVTSISANPNHKLAM